MNKSEKLVSCAFDASRAGAFKWDIRHGLVELSAELLPLLGLSASRFDGRFDTLAAMLHPVDRERIQRYANVPRTDRVDFETEVRFIAGADSVRWFSLQGEFGFDDEGKAHSALGIMQQIPQSLVTERRMRMQQSILFSLLAEERLDALPLDEALARLTRKAARAMEVERASVWRIEEASGDLVCMDLYRASVQQHERALRISPARYPIYFEALARNRAITAHYAPTDPRTKELNEGYLQPLGITSMLDSTIRRGGETVGVMCVEHVGPQRHWSTDEQQFVASLADLATLLMESNERRELAEQMQAAARRDGLTGLPNRLAFTERIESLIGDGDAFAVMVIDLAEFRDFNLVLGYAIGDLLLVAVAVRLQQALAPDCVLCRFGGTAFGAVLPGVASGSQAADRAQAVLDAMRQPVEVEGARVTFNGRVGISLFPAHGRTAEEVLRGADCALQSKRGVRGYQLYEPGRDRPSPRRLTLMHDLIRAVSADALDIAYQPKVDLFTKHVVGAEVLSRWTHADLGNIAPTEFIALAELGDTIRDLTLNVLRRCARDWASLYAQGCAMPLSVNLSPYILYDPQWAEAIADILASNGLPPENIELEITESAFITKPEEALLAMGRLRDAGVTFALDDFGIGYSSMEHLSRMPIQVLKIDKLFIQGVSQDAKSRAIVRSALLLGKELGLDVVAEGVETSEQLGILRDMGCCIGQGYLLGRPGSIAQLIDTVKSSRGA